MKCSARVWLLLCSVCVLSPRPVLAQAAVVEAKQYFEAGAAAYTAGDYQAAIQAFDVAYASTPLAAIAFSLAQAERRQYFASHEPEHLTRAIELFRRYLEQVRSGGRRADATDALAQLEPLALAVSQQSAESSAARSAAARKTRLMVRSPTPGARIALDDAAEVPSPAINEVTVGTHRVQVQAPGYFPIEQQVVAIEGELVPIEIALRQRPALLLIEHREEADIYVDGVPVNAAANSDTFSLPAGEHALTFSKKGHELRSISLSLAPGQTRHVSPDLNWTSQRVAAVGLLVTGGATFAVGLVLSGLALHYEKTAHDIDLSRQKMALRGAELDDYHDAVEARDRMRIAAVGSFAVTAGTVLTGLVLYQFDDATPYEAAVRTAPIAIVPATDGSGAELQLSLTSN
jgi:hypothetical protein